MTTIKLKNGSGAPTAGDLVQGEPALDLTNKRLYTEDSGGTVIEVGTNPTSVTTGVVTATSLDISGDIDVDGTTNLDVVDIDGAVDMASTLAVSGVLTANAGVVVDNFTIDGAEIDCSADMTLDVAGDLTLDVSGGDVRIKADGTQEMQFKITDGANVDIISTVADDDIRLRGNDGGATITALTLDMSAAGAAIFNAGATFGSGNVGIGDTSPSYPLTIHDTGDGIKFEVSDTVDANYRIQVSGSNIVTGPSTSSAYTFQTGNTERMRIDSSGNLLVGQTSVGVGTVGGTMYADGTGKFTVDGSIVAYLNRLTSDGTILSLRKDTTEVGSIGTELDRLFIGSDDSMIFFDAGSTNAIWPWTSTATSSGDADNTIDIGDSSNRFKDLYLSGTAYSAALNVDGGSSGIINFGDVTSNYGRLYADSTGTYVGSVTADPLIFRTTNTERMRIDSSGNVGMGRAPVAIGAFKIVEAYNNASSGGIFSAINNTGEFRFVKQSVDGYINMTDSGSTIFQSNGAERMRIGSDGSCRWTPDGTTQDMTLDASGNLLVGTTGAITTGNGFSVSSTGQARIGRASTGSIKQIIFSNPNGEVGSITTSGSATAYNQSSDERLKENIVDAPSASNDIDSIQVRSFDWKADGSHQKYGMVAQELNTVAPEAVTIPDDPEEMAGVDYSKLVPMLVKEIQSLRARVAQLEGAN